MKHLYRSISKKAVCIYLIIGTLFCLSAQSAKPHTQSNRKVSEKTAAVGSTAEAPEEIPPRVIFGQQLNTLLNEQKADEAIALFDTLPEEDRGSLSIQNLKVAVLVSTGRIKDAEETAKALEKRYPNDLNVLYTMTMVAQAKNDKKMRKTYLKKILKLDPDNVQALQEEGVDFYNQGSYKEAGETFSKILKKHPDNIQALIWCGKVYYLDNKMPEAEQCYRTALKYQPKNSLAIAELARIKSETNRMAEAIEDIQKAIELEPDAAPHWTDLGSYNLQIGRREEALAAFNRAIELVPDSYFIHIYLAGLNDDLGNKEDAIKHYKKVTELYPQYYFAYEGLGILLFEKKDWEDSRRAFVNALRYAPTNVYYALSATVCSYKMGKKKEAKDFMSKYLKTIDRTKHETDYYLCRLFIDFAGDSDVNNRITKEKDETERLRKFFYLAEFYRLAGKGHLAEKVLLEIKTTQTPNFFEYRLAVSELTANTDTTAKK
ncbi:tetratricopeptide repeat protein [Treponema sp. OMZ 305]|uniref:tetratricopeptide repeat protein n=1 Tax=Treponema sp. OMZ 305 TaxID=1659192 RepID=UPI0020A51CDE|nr:tetratricopeptide repeat protein [Treponema sp. OMZ 305]UTC57162.1 tetratricopeptide repeat protein [Treponema sp. OMZ 305]